jgi:hypothetical protein
LNFDTLPDKMDATSKFGGILSAIILHLIQENQKKHKIAIAQGKEPNFEDNLLLKGLNDDKTSNPFFSKKTFIKSSFLIFETYFCSFRISLEL